MKKPIRTIFNMFLVLEDYMKAQQAIIQTIEGLEPEVQLFNANLAKLKLLNSDLSNLPDRPAASKNKFEAKLDSVILFNSRKVAAYAAIREDTPLLDAVNIAESALRRLEDNEKVGFARKLHGIIESNLAGLVKHGLTAATQTELQSSTDAFAEAIPTVRGTTVNNSNALAQYEALVEETYARVRNKMDVLVNSVLTEQPEFVGVYRLSRKKVDLARTTLALNGYIRQDDGSPVQGARITIDSQIVKSTGTGNFRLLRKDPGVYKLKVEKPGFAPFEQEVIINDPGQTTRIQIVLSAA